MRTSKTTGRKKAAPAKKPQPATQQFKGDFVPSDAILKYVAATSRAQAARVIGVSTTTLDKARLPPEGSGFVKKSIEVAARGLLREMGQELTRSASGEPNMAAQVSNDVTAFLVKVDASNRDDFLNLARIAKVSVTPI